MADLKPIILKDNRFDDGTPTATDTASGFDVLNIKDLRTYTLWKANSTGIKYITIDCGSSKSVDALFIINHNFNTAGINVSVEYSATGVWGGEEVEALAPFNPSDDKAFLKLFTTQSARYWRIKLSSGSAAPYIGVAILGDRFSFERYLTGSFDPTPEQTIAETNKSKGGNILGSVIERYERKINADFNNITPSWYKNTFFPLWLYLRQLKPFAWAWNMTSYTDEAFFVKVPDNFSLKSPYNPVRRTLRLQFEGIVEE